MKDHVVINSDRTVKVPDSLVRLGVQYDHNVNTIIFDCPRYLDDDSSVDMSKMQIFINYMLPNKQLGASLATDVEIDPDDETLMHFSWKITRAITQYKGLLSTLICIKQVDSDGNEIYHWNTLMFQRFAIDEGMESQEVVAEENQDVIAQLLTEYSRLNAISDKTIVNTNNILNEIETIKKSGSDWKSLIASAITDMGVETSANSDRQTFIDNIYNIHGDSAGYGIINNLIIVNGANYTLYGTCVIEQEEE